MGLVGEVFLFICSEEEKRRASFEKRKSKWVAGVWLKDLKITGDNILQLAN